MIPDQGVCPAMIEFYEEKQRDLVAAQVLAGIASNSHKDVVRLSPVSKVINAIHMADLLINELKR